MKNKGFTLVELLAVIAILAILVIVAMPNVLGMFNEAKVNVFVTDVQKIIDAATTAFTKDALNNAGKTVYYSSVDNATLKTKKLDMSGAEKDYFIEIDRNGEFKRVVVYDDNYCYDIYSSGTNGEVTGTNSKLVYDKIKKTTVVVDDIWESGSDSIAVTMNGTRYKVNGCEGKITVNGKDTNQILEKVEIEGVKYDFIPGMTWGEWTRSKYNTIGEPHIAPAGISFIGVGEELQNYIAYNTAFVFRNSNSSILGVTVNENQQIIVGEKYHFDNSSWSYGGINKTNSYYIVESWDDITYDMQKQKIDW